MNSRPALALIATLSSLIACFPQTSAAPYHVATTSEIVARYPRDPAFDRTADELEESIAKATAGYTKELGQDFSGELGAFQEHPIGLKRGRCYVVVVRLGSGAKFSEFASKGTSLVITGVPWTGSINAGPGVVGPGAIGKLGCPEADAPNALFDVRAIVGSASSTARVHELGSGPFTASVYSKAIDEKGLAELKADKERQLAEIEAFKQREHDKLAATCQACDTAYNTCIADWRRGASRSTCDAERHHCRIPCYRLER